MPDTTLPERWQHLRVPVPEPEPPVDPARWQHLTLAEPVPAPVVADWQRLHGDSPLDAIRLYLWQKGALMALSKKDDGTLPPERLLQDRLKLAHDLLRLALDQGTTLTPAQGAALRDLVQRLERVRLGSPPQTVLDDKKEVSL